MAIDNNELRGGLSFIDYKHPAKSVIALWINTVFVEPQSRGLGIGSKLLSYAEKIIKRADWSEVFVYTSVPQMYVNPGWKILKQDEYDFVLLKSL